MEVPKYWRLSKSLVAGEFDGKLRVGESNSAQLYEEWKRSFNWIDPVGNANVSSADEIAKARLAASERLGLVVNAMVAELVG